MNIFPKAVQEVLTLIAAQNGCNTSIVKTVDQSTGFLCAVLVSNYRLGDPDIGGTGIQMREDISQDQRVYKIRYYLHRTKFESKVAIHNRGDIVKSNVDILNQ